MAEGDLFTRCLGVEIDKDDLGLHADLINERIRRPKRTVEIIHEGTAFEIDHADLDPTRRFEVAKKDPWLCAALVTIDEASGKAQAIERIQVAID
jgi:hypothetical protein